MLSHLYHAPGSDPCGAATVGCTEATLLSGLAAKKLWQARRRKDGKPADRPNLVIGSNYQVQNLPSAQGKHQATGQPCNMRGGCKAPFKTSCPS
jgi:hypothetical protein